MISLLTNIVVFLGAAGLTFLFFIAILRLLRKMQANANPDEMEVDDSFTSPEVREARHRKALIVAGMIGAGLGALINVGLIGILGGAAVMILGGHVILTRKEKQRQIRLDEQFVNALSLMANAIRAGQTIPQAIGSSINGLQAPLLVEFVTMHRQIRVGMPIEEVLERFAERVGSSDVQLATQAMIFSTRTGADAPGAFRRISETIRTRRAIQGKIDVLTAQGKTQGVVVGLIPFVIIGVLFFVNPEYVGLLFHTTLGNIALGVVITMQMIAYFVIRKIVSVQV